MFQEDTQISEKCKDGSHLAHQMDPPVSPWGSKPCARFGLSAGVKRFGVREGMEIEL